MTTRHRINEEALSGRPQARRDTGALLNDWENGAGIAAGHSGAGPEFVSAVYHFGDRANS